MNETKIPKGYKKTEVGVIPEDWEVKTVDAIAEVKSGKRLPLGNSLSESKTPHPYIRVTDMYPGGINVSEIKYVPEHIFPAIKNYRIFKEDIFISVAGSLGIVGKIPAELDGACLTENADRITKISCDRDFLLSIFSSPLIQNTIVSEQTLGAQPKLALTRIRKFLIPLPYSLPEQIAIATALSDVDALIAGLDQLIAKKRDLKQAAMQQLLTGQKRLPGFQIKSGYKQTEVGMIPEDWDAVPLGHCLSSHPKYGINAAAVPYLDKLPVYIRITDISVNGKFMPEKIVSVNAYNSDQYFLKDGDIVFARTGASVGKSYLYNSNDGPLVFAGFLIRVEPNPASLNPKFLSSYVTTGAYWQWVRLMSMRSGQPGINGNEYSHLPIPLPPFPEQTAIAAILSDMDTELTAIEQRRDKTRALKQGMMQELLTGKTRLI